MQIIFRVFVLVECMSSQISAITNSIITLKWHQKVKFHVLLPMKLLKMYLILYTEVMYILSSFSKKQFVIPKMFSLEYIHCIVSAQKVCCVMLVLDAYIMHYCELFK